jgi:multicomponent Na+:H+ antiporter subunit D
LRAILPAPIILALAGAAVTLTLHRRVALQRLVGLVTVAGVLASSVWILVEVARGGPVAVDIGGWPAPIGVSLVADLFSSLVLVVSAATVLAVLVFAIGQLSMLTEARYFHPLYLVLTAGVSASLLTGDLFNLFVAFEVTLIASYALITMGGQRVQIRPAVTYVVVNLFASTLFITAVAFVYASVGTVNMADLAGKIATLDPHLQQALALLFVVVFGIKAAIFPLFFWLPDSYPTAPTSITAVFAGLLTKIGVYSIVRSQTVIFAGARVPRAVILSIAGATMVVGVLGAIAQDDIKRILSFHIISQIGYMVFGLGISTVAGIAAAILYILHHIPVKTSLFLVGGLIEKTTGTGALHRLGGLSRRMPLAGLLFMIPALSLAGVPPLSGFFGKLALVEAGMSTGLYVVVGISLAVSLLTLFSMMKVWAGVFWGEPDEPPPLEQARGSGKLHLPPLMTAASAALVGLTLAIAVGVEPIYRLCIRAAEGLTDTSAYIQAVMSR